MKQWNQTSIILKINACQILHACEIIFNQVLKLI